MGCKQSKREVSLMITLDSKYFQDSEIICQKSLSSPVQELFREAKKRQINQKECYDMKLLLGSRSIDSSSTLSLKELGVSKETPLKLSVKANCVKIKVLIQSDPPSKCTVSMALKKKISDLKSKLSKDQGEDNIILLHRSIEIPSTTLISQLNLKEAEMITVIHKNLKSLAYWKYKKPGLIIEGLCMNSECQAYRQRVSIPKNFGTFDLSNELAVPNVCPVCDKEISKVASVCVAWCKYSAEFLMQNERSAKSESVDYCFELPQDWQQTTITVSLLD